MNNLRIRETIFINGLAKKDIAKTVGIRPETFSRWIACELNEDRKQKILQAIEELLATTQATTKVIE